MKQFSFAFFLVVSFIATALCAEQNWAGEYTDKHFLNGKAVFQLSIEQGGGKIQVSFDAVHNDGHGCAPEAVGLGSVSKSGALQFKWEDSFKNKGTGTITRSGNDIIVSIKPIRVTNSRCLEFYRQNIQLKRVK